MFKRLQAWLRRKITQQQQMRRKPTPRRLAGARATRQQFLEATRNIGVIVVATCFTAGWVITNPVVNSDNMGWGISLGLLLILVGSFGYGYVERSKASDDRSNHHE